MSNRQETKNYKAFLRLDEKKFRGKYVVFVKGKLFKAGKNIIQILKGAKHQFPNDIPFIAKVPAGGMMVLWLP